MAIPARHRRQGGQRDATRLHIRISGAVQGVGFRPFVFRLANELGVRGSVSNDPGGVTVDAEGSRDVLQIFLLRIENEKPPMSAIDRLECQEEFPKSPSDFRILPSVHGERATAEVLPDIAVCSACLQEMRDPSNRRYRYPFTNCSHCGPRYSIITAIPYDRRNTAMRGFEMCPACRSEYENPTDRRFHAQPIACPACGPQLELWTAEGRSVAVRDAALALTIDALTAGQVVAVKGLGGFHLMVNATNPAAVRTLRERKHREAKPLAVMLPDLSWANWVGVVSSIERQLLLSPEAPIVLLQRRAKSMLAPEVAPGCGTVGVMLPYTPLHHLLLEGFGAPLVATSGNRSEEPICTDEHESLDRLRGIADLFLVHDRPIVRAVDDSIVRMLNKVPVVLRRARGYAPLSVAAPPGAGNGELLAVGAHEKSSIALAKAGRIHLSQHLGDLDTTAARKNLSACLGDMGSLFQVKAGHVVFDLHPDYASSVWARESGMPLVQVQHHYAHILSCMTEHGIDGPVFGVAWDGSGAGTDGTIWGGEFLRASYTGFERSYYLRPFALPGGESAVREPRRVAVSLLHSLGLLETNACRDLCGIAPAVQVNLRRMIERKIHCPMTSSAGRLFDAVAALLGMCQVNAFEGQAAMALEAAAGECRECFAPWPIPLCGPLLDWGPMVAELIHQVREGAEPKNLAWRFHRTLAEGISLAAIQQDLRQVVLTGGCFQNALLTTLTVDCLEARGFRVYTHRRVPPNDGGIALGQAAYALCQQNPEE